VLNGRRDCSRASPTTAVRTRGDVRGRYRVHALRERRASRDGAGTRAFHTLPARQDDHAMRLPGPEHDPSAPVAPRGRIAVFEEDLSGGGLPVGVAEIVVGELPQEFGFARIGDVQRHHSVAAVSKAQEQNGAPDVGLPGGRGFRSAATVVLGEGTHVVEVANYDATVGKPLLAAAGQ